MHSPATSEIAALMANTKNKPGSLKIIFGAILMHQIANYFKI
jgi:hypothetical protein